ncbi:MAG: hypothetical protein JWL59_3657 [Chthoniobacteraceae bacterium]|nr:hypothetical protein [Chthoniobacteraceae bacterium]
MNKQEPAAAAIVKHRGVSVTIYGPLKDRKKEIYLLSYHVGSRREKCTSKGTLEVARQTAKKVAEGIAGGDLIDALHLTPLDRRVFVTAKEACAPMGRAVDAVCRDAAEAAKFLGDVSLVEAAKFYAAHHSVKLPSATPADIAEQLYAWMKGKRRSETTIATLKSILKPFGERFNVPITQITTQDLDKWLSSHVHHSPRTALNFIRGLVRLFNFAKGRFLPADAPTAADRLEAPSDDNREAVAIFRPWEMRKILLYAPEELLPIIVLGAFAGLRTIELARIEWSAVHFQTTGKKKKPESVKYPHGFIEVSAATAKQHRSAMRRIIPISANLAAWLAPYRLKSGPISDFRRPSSIARAMTRIIDEINAIESKANRPEVSRPANGLRHSYGSYRLPQLEDVAALALEMNTSPKKIFSNYREVVTPRDVGEWWAIAPVKSAKIIPIAARA